MPDESNARSYKEFAAEIGGHKEMLKNAFAAIAEFTDDQLSAVFQLAVESFDKERPDAEEVSKRIKVPPQEAEQIIDIITALMPTSLSSESPEEIAEILAETGIIEGEHARQHVARAVRVVQGLNAGLRRKVSRSRLANAVLPSFKSFGARVDVALRFDSEDKVTESVPVLVVSIVTDVDSRPFCFQLAAHEAGKLLAELQSAVMRLERADEWSNSQQ